MLYTILVVAVASLFLQVCIFLLHKRTLNSKDSEFYTDYVKGNLTLRVFKPEFEYQAIGNVPLSKLLDRGTLSQFYFWALIEK